jgi:hypothetical protein
MFRLEVRDAIVGAKARRDTLAGGPYHGRWYDALYILLRSIPSFAASVSFAQSSNVPFFPSGPTGTWMMLR